MKQIFRRRKPPLKVKTREDRNLEKAVILLNITADSPEVKKDAQPSPDQKRAAAGVIFRNGIKMHVTPGEKIDIKRYNGLILKCGQCGQVFSENEADTHLKNCQPMGALCGKCGKKFLPHDFINHFKGCKGVGAEIIKIAGKVQLAM